MPRALLEHEINTLCQLVSTTGISGVLACVASFCRERSAGSDSESEEYAWRDAARLCESARDKIPKKLA